MKKLIPPKKKTQYPLMNSRQRLKNNTYTGILYTNSESILQMLKERDNKTKQSPPPYTG